MPYRRRLIRTITYGEDNEPHTVSRLRMRHFTPEPFTRERLGSSPVDFRRFSVAGDLDFYRPYHSGEVIYERAEPLKVSVERSRPESNLFVYDWGRLGYNKGANFRDPLDEYELRREAELRVKGRSNYVPPLAAYYNFRSPPLASSSSSVEVVNSRPRSSYTTNSNHSRLALDQSHRDLEDFERLMKRNFGYGGAMTRNSGYVAPPYYYYNYYYPYSAPAYSPYYTAALPSTRYDPYYYYSPSYRSPVVSTLDTLPYYYRTGYSRPYVSTYQKPYTSNYRLYSRSPARITSPGGYYVSGYDPIVSGYDRYPVRYYTPFVY
jgi:hypothetical protein